MVESEEVEEENTDRTRQVSNDTEECHPAPHPSQDTNVEPSVKQQPSGVDRHPVRIDP